MFQSLSKKHLCVQHFIYYNYVFFTYIQMTCPTFYQSHNSVIMNILEVLFQKKAKKWCKSLVVRERGCNFVIRL